MKMDCEDVFFLDEVKKITKMPKDRGCFPLDHIGWQDFPQMDLWYWAYSGFTSGVMGSISTSAFQRKYMHPSIWTTSSKYLSPTSFFYELGFGTSETMMYDPLSLWALFSIPQIFTHITSDGTFIAPVGA